MTLMFPEFAESSFSAAVACTGTARSWCDPSQYVEIVGLDFGCNSVHYYMARSGKHGKLSFSELIGWLDRLQRNTLVVCESAHLGVPQTAMSLAQAFKGDELLDLYGRLRARGVTLKLAPHAHTGQRMRLWVAHHFPDLMRDAQKSDAADAIALAIYVDRCNEISLADPYKSFHVSSRRAFGQKVIQLSNLVLNAERTDEYGGKSFPLVIEAGRAMWRKGGCVNLKCAVTVASTLVWQADGKLYVFTHRGQVPGRWFWMRNVLRMSPWHHRGGIARSNLMWHAFRPYLARHCHRLGVNIKSGGRYKKFSHMNDKEKAARTSGMRSFRNMLLRARDLCMAHAREIGAGTKELTDIHTEATDGTHP